MQRSIQHKWFLNYSPEIVWDYLTRAELIAQWIMENDFRPIAGQKFMFRTKPKIELDFDGKIYCEVLEIIPFKRLSYSWRCGPGSGKITLDSVVVWTLIKKDNGTELQLEHNGFEGKERDMYYLLMDKGWYEIGNGLITKLNVTKNDATKI